MSASNTTPKHRKPRKRNGVGCRTTWTKAPLLGMAAVLTVGLTAGVAYAGDRALFPGVNNWPKNPPNASQLTTTSGMAAAALNFALAQVGKWGALAGAYKFQTWATEWIPESWKQALESQQQGAPE